jgi:hypothetical protein
MLPIATKLAAEAPSPPKNSANLGRTASRDAARPRRCVQ